MSANYPNRYGSYSAPGPLGLQYNERVAKMLAGKGAKDAFDHIRYDSIRLSAGAAVSVGTTRLFQVPLGQQTTINNGSGQYTKSLIDTNMENAGSLPAGQEMIVNSIQVMVTIPAQTDTTYSSSGTDNGLPTSTVGAAVVAGVNLLQALVHQTYIRFKVGEKVYEEGPLFQFPSAFGISGFTGATTAAQTNNEGVSNNGFGRERTLFMSRQIPELVNFAVDLSFIDALTITRQCWIHVLLHGILFRPIQ